MWKLFARAQVWWVHGLGSDEGATAVEYALMLALIAMVVFGAVAFLGQQTNGLFGRFSFGS